MKQVRVAIIGAGSAGLSARSEVSKQTDSYVVIDKGPIGTTCARVGCMPSKALIQVANDFHRRQAFDQMGIRGGERLALDAKAALVHVRALRDRFVDSVTEGMKSWREKLIMAPARLVDERTLDAGGERIEAERIIIATGSRPIIPDAWKPFESFVLDSDSIFDLDGLPESIAVIGLGAVGLELGQALARLWVNVRGFDPGRALGGLSSPPLQDHALEIIGKDLPITTATAEPVRVENGALVIAAGEERFRADAALLAIGRRPNLDGLAIQNAGIALNEFGSLDVDPCTMRVGGTGIYVAGDVSGLRPVLHEAVDEGRIAGYNAVRDVDHPFERRPRLLITFCEPNIAIVGDGYAALSGRGVEIAAGKSDFSGQGRAMMMLENLGQAEIYLDRMSGRLLGAELFAPEGEHLAHFLATALACKLDARSLLSVPFYHPVIEEGLRTALKRAARRLDDDLTGIDLMRCDEPPAGGLTRV